MEIIDYLRILRRRRLVLVLVPLIAVVAAVAWALTKPQTYAAVATINGTALVGTTTSQFTGPQGVSQFVSSFDAAANGPYVLNVVSDRTSVPVRDLRDGLLVTQVGDSSTMRIAYESGKRETVEPVLGTAVSETLVALFQPRADQSVRDRDAAAEQVEEANAAAEALAEKQGRADPRENYQALVGKISNLEQQQVTLRANGNAISAAALDAPLKAARAQASGYGPILAEYATVLAKQQAAADALASAQQEYRLATGQVTATSSDRVVFISGVSSSAAANEAWALVLPVLGAGIFTAFVLMFALELLSRSRAQGRRDLAEVAGTAGGAHAGPVTVDADAPASPAGGRPDDPGGDVTVAQPERPHPETDTAGSRPKTDTAGIEPESAVEPEPDIEQENPSREGHLVASTEANGFGWNKGRHGAARATRQPRER